MGSAVGTFMGRAGPPEIVRYSFKSERSHIKATLVEHVPVVEPGLHLVALRILVIADVLMGCSVSVAAVTKRSQVIAVRFA